MHNEAKWRRYIRKEDDEKLRRKQVQISEKEDGEKERRKLAQKREKAGRTMALESVLLVYFFAPYYVVSYLFSELLPTYFEAVVSLCPGTLPATFLTTSLLL